MNTSAGRRRDRDEEGRARNARPRDGLGRPLPYDAEGTERQPEGVERTPAQSLDEGQQLLRDGKPFHAHEVFEDAWKLAEGPERAVWKGMAQLAVGVTHAARGNRKGGVSLLRRGAEAIEVFADDAPHGIDIAGVTRWAHAAIAELEAGPDTGSPVELSVPNLRGRE